MKTRLELRGLLEVVDQTMERAANDALNHSELWTAWRRAREALPPLSDIPQDLLGWWESQLIEANRRAFDHKLLRHRFHRGDYNNGIPPGDGLVWNSAPCIYRGCEIRAELRRAAQGCLWWADVTLGAEHTFAVEERLRFPRIPDTGAGAFGAYALIMKAVKREIDRKDPPL